MSSTNHSMEGSLSGSEEKYDSEGAMKFIVVTVLIYALVGILSLLLVRIVRRAKLRQSQMRTEELHSVRQYLRELPRLQMEGSRQKLMHNKIKTALSLWKSDDMIAFNRPLLTVPSPPAHPHTTPRTPQPPAEASVHHPNQMDKIEEEEEDSGHAKRTSRVQISHLEFLQHPHRLGDIDTKDERRSSQNDLMNGDLEESETVEQE